MQIEGSDGSINQINTNSITVLGRGDNFHPNDLSVSRRHISFDFNPLFDDTQPCPTFSFEVVGKNPVWVSSNTEDGKNVRVFKRFERGEMGIGDNFCVSAKNPVWFTVKKVKDRGRYNEELRSRINDELSQSLDYESGSEGNGDLELDSVDISNIDPVREFGFLVIGHEFDPYEKQMIHDIKKFNWFLEDPRRDSDDEKGKATTRGGSEGKKRSKKTRGGDNDDVDDEWRNESEDEEPVGTKARKAQRSNYHTRSKHHGIPSKDNTDMGSDSKTSSTEDEDEYDDKDENENEDDETLGGFIVDDDTADEEDEMEEEEEEEEEEFVDDEE